MSPPETIPFVALLLAAGQSTRLQGPQPKPYLPLRGRTVLEWSAIRLARIPGHAGTVLAVDPESLAERIPEIRDSLEAARVIEVTRGGATRQESCRLAFAAARLRLPATDLVLVHDCARPFFPLRQTQEALAAAAREGGAILGHRARDTLKRIAADGRIEATIAREDVFQAATPQIFQTEAFERMLAVAAEAGLVQTDEAGLAEAAGVPVLAIESPSTNIKLTRPEDLLLLPALEALLEGAT